jgi:hypothetical protein
MPCLQTDLFPEAIYVLMAVKMGDDPEMEGANQSVNKDFMSLTPL